MLPTVGVCAALNNAHTPLKSHAEVSGECQQFDPDILLPANRQQLCSVLLVLVPVSGRHQPRRPVTMIYEVLCDGVGGGCV